MAEFRFTYEVITPESAAEGDFADHGFYMSGGWRYSMAENREEVLAESQAGEYDYSSADFKEVIRIAEDHGIHEPSSSFIREGVWFSSIDPDRDYATGEDTYYSLHVEGVTLATLKRIHRLLNGQPIFLKDKNNA